MSTTINLENIYKPSEDVVAREVQGEFIIIPITSGIGDLEDEIFSLNETGRSVWDKLDAKKSLREVAQDLALDFEATNSEIENDILSFSEELLKRRMLVEVKES